MVRTVFAGTVVALVAVTAGCRMCAHPYDYCGPTFTGECGRECLPNARAGSILSQAVQPVAGFEVGPEMIIPVPDADMVGPAPGLRQQLHGAPPAQPQRWTARRPHSMRR